MRKLSKIKKFERIRNTILKKLDKTGWEWNPHLSYLLDQVDIRSWKIKKII
jgi:hypothetical protein